MTTKVEIPLSKKKLILTLAGAIGFVAIGFWFVIHPPLISNPFFGNPTLIFVTGMASILIFGLCVVLVARKIPDTKPGLIIDNVGITDNSSGTSAGQILWRDIEDISVLEIHRQKLIMFQVKNPQHYIDKQQGGFKKKMMQMNFKMYGTPLSVTSTTLKIDFNELMKLLTDGLTASRQVSQTLTGNG